MVNHQLVVISFTKIVPRLKANAVKSANLRAPLFVLYLLSTRCVLTLAYPTLFPLVLLGILYCCSVPADAREFIRATRSTRTSRHSSPNRRPCGALLPRVSRICFYASA